MSIDVLPEASEQSSLAEPSQTSSPPENSGGSMAGTGRWWKRGLLGVGLLAVVGIAVTFVPWSGSTTDSDRMTHTISRGDLKVAVIEQGTLESANNAEIKCKVRGWSKVIWVVEGGTVVQPGDELVRLDTKAIDDAISLQTTNTHTARATLAESTANVNKAEIAIPAYLNGRYKAQLQQLEQQRIVAQTNLMAARKMLDHSKLLFKRGYVTKLEVEGNAFTVTRAELELEVVKEQIHVLETYTKEMELETLNGNLTAARSKMEADQSGLAMDEGRLARAEEELENCVIRADREGLVIYPSAAVWKNAPDITEGASVRKDQVLLLMPDLSQMQVKVGIHESIIDRMKPGLTARIVLPDKELQGEVKTVASVTRPAGWWTGNVVKYDTIIDLPPVDGLKPGMSAEVEITLATHTDVLTIPVAAVVETEDGSFCWVESAEGPKRREIKLGDSNDVYIVVESGLKEGDEVVLNPLAYVDEAQSEVLVPKEDKAREAGRSESPAAEAPQI